jgi:hypothetical protein
VTRRERGPGIEQSRVGWPARDHKEISQLHYHHSEDSSSYPIRGGRTTFPSSSTNTRTRSSRKSIVTMASYNCQHCRGMVSIPGELRGL